MIKGTYIIYENGKEICRSSNVITKFGKRFLTNFIAGLVPNGKKDMAIGIDNTAATVNDTRLGFEFYRAPIDISSVNIRTVDNVTSYSVVYKATIPQDVSGKISEIGLYPSTNISVSNYDSAFVSDFNDPLSWLDDAGNPAELSFSNSRIGNSSLKLSSSNESAKEYFANLSMDLSGYGLADSVKLSYFQEDLNLSSIKIRFYSSDLSYFESTITPTNATGFKFSSNILMSEFYGNAIENPDKINITKVGIIVVPKTGEDTVIYLDGLRINDEDTFNPNMGIISRSVLGQSIDKLSGRSIDIEYVMDLSF